MLQDAGGPVTFWATVCCWCGWRVLQNRIGSRMTAFRGRLPYRADLTLAVSLLSWLLLALCDVLPCVGRRSHLSRSLSAVRSSGARSSATRRSRESAS